jgi:hypothetical protein
VIFVISDGIVKLFNMKCVIPRKNMKLKYFLPDWEDRLDPNFDFDNDEFSRDHKRNPYENDIYIHQLFGDVPIDGFLVSLSIFQSKISLSSDGVKYQIRDRSNIKDYLKIPEKSSLEVMGDCGAFGYVREKSPPLPFYSVRNIAGLYEKLGFDIGVSVDHLVVDYVLIKNTRSGRREKKALSRNTRNMRIKITLKNAREFLRLCREEKYNFIPVGVAQGYNLKTYKCSIKSLIEMGYEHIGIGGLVQYRTEFILDILSEIQPFLNGTKIHLFGITRLNHSKDFERLGVISLDSASFFRRAWLRSGQNYLAPNGKWYTAIRIPQSSNPRIVRNANLNGFSLEDLKKMEKEAFDALMKYQNGEISIDDALNDILSYDRLLLRKSDSRNLEGKYRKTLEDRPWETCDCSICKNIGIHVMMFRGYNRNKRRGFHNIWTIRKNSKCAY